MTQASFHRGELAAQALAGIAPPIAAIRDYMPDQHRAFFGLLPFLPIATSGANGEPVATILTGPPGFIVSPDPNTLRIAARPNTEDPANRFLRPGAPVGLLGIDLATRRRNRANGVLRSDDPDGLTIGITQSFGNCPKYIQSRIWRDGTSASGQMEVLTRLDPASRHLITQADTFFIASTSGGEAGDKGGIDISHRGGRPGFVAIDGETLIIPDFKGNHHFNTLGNLLLDPRAALLFVDWKDGTLLHLQGNAEVLWDVDGGLAGAERLMRISVTGGWRRRGALPLRWSFQTYAPQLQRTGVWNDKSLSAAADLPRR